MTASASRQTRQDTGIVARRIVLSGQVQGVGFRPFIYRLATHYRLAGWVKNCVGTVEILIQGERSDVNHFQRDIFTQKPPLAKPALVSESETPAAETTTAAFTILPSQREGDAVIRVPADLFLCDDCLRELNDPA
ncbi:MAG TPA: carbamoyltransferase HypF, partial [Thiotrichales bacterium]|nr:carbamoyltransferase HypF [Thiotrichales bacterium]